MNARDFMFMCIGSFMGGFMSQTFEWIGIFSH